MFDIEKSVFELIKKLFVFFLAGKLFQSGTKYFVKKKRSGSFYYLKENLDLISHFLYTINNKSRYYMFIKKTLRQIHNSAKLANINDVFFLNLYNSHVIINKSNHKSIGLQ